MSCKTIGIGICHSRGGVPTPKPIMLEVVPAKYRQPYHSTVELCLERAVAATKSLFLWSDQFNPKELKIQTEIPTELLEGPSFGLAILLSFIGRLLNTGTREDILLTGEVLPDGRICSVGNVTFKIAVESDETHLIIPRENDPDYTLVSKGPRIIRADHTKDILWLGLGTTFLFDHLLRESSQMSDEINIYLTSCLKEAYLPSDIGECCRNEYYTKRTFAEMVHKSHMGWARILLPFAPISGPNPTNLLQAIFCEFDWNTVNTTDPQTAESVVSRIFQELISCNDVKNASHLLNLFLLSRKTRDVLTSPGPIRTAILRVHFELSRREDKYGLSQLFAGLDGIARKMQSSSIIDSDLLQEIKDPPLSTIIIHDLKDGRIVLGRFQFHFRGRPLQFEIESPMALFDSSSTVPSIFRHDNWHPGMDAIFSSEEGELVAKNFSPQTFNLNRFNTKIFWRDGMGCWPPSIDSLHFLADVYNSGLHLCDERGYRILDLCCGCGVIGITIASVGNLSRVDFMDFEPAACATTRINILENFHDCGGWVIEDDKDIGVSYYNTYSHKGNLYLQFSVYEGEATFLLTSLLKKRERKPPLYHRVFFMPPYLPEPDLLGLPLWRAVAGTELLEWILSNGFRFTREIIFAYSTIADIAVRRALNRCVHVDRVETLGEHWVALRIPGFVDAFEPMADGQRVGRLSERAEAYWNRHLLDLKETKELSRDNIIPKDGHGFKWAQRILTKKVVYLPSKD